MRIEFLTQDDPLYVMPFFEEFVRHYGAEFEILQISTSPTMGKRSRLQMLKELTQLYGPLGMSRLVARVGTARILGALPKSRLSARFYTLAQLCRAYEIPHARIGNPNHDEFIAALRRRAPDLLVSVACPYVLKESLLTLPPLGAINIHHAPLPRYKGMMPTFWQMFHGEKSVGLTIHSMAVQIDTGDALFQGEQTIELGETLDHLIQRSKRHGAHCMAVVLRKIKAGTAERQPMDHSQGSYFTFPNAREIREFRRRGHRAI